MNLVHYLLAKAIRSDDHLTKPPCEWSYCDISKLLPYEHKLLQFSLSFLVYFSFSSFLIATIGEAIPLQTIAFFLSQVIALFFYLTCSSYLKLILSLTNSLILVSIPYFHHIP